MDNAHQQAWPHVEIYHGDSLEYLRRMPSRSIDLILTDPPYYRVKKNEDWDTQWDNPVLFIDWLRQHFVEWKRVLKYNGSLFCFASPQMSARVEVALRDEFSVLNHIVWAKETGLHLRTNKSIQRSWFPCSERILFCEQQRADSMALGEETYVGLSGESIPFAFEDVRAYLDNERIRTGMTRPDVNRALGKHMASHWLSTSQWRMPTQGDYMDLQRIFRPIVPDALSLPYEDLVAMYEMCVERYEGRRRPFQVEGILPSNDVWTTYNPVPYYEGKHSCEKPVEMLADMIQATTRPGALVFDGFAGSGATALAALRTGRNSIVCDRSLHWVERIRARVAEQVALPAGDFIDQRPVPKKRRRKIKVQGVRKTKAPLPLFGDTDDNS